MNRVSDQIFVRGLAVYIGRVSRDGPEWIALISLVPAWFIAGIRGKVLLEVDISELIGISLGAVKTGFSFGWSALMPDSVYTSPAICSETCEIFSVPGNDFLNLINNDHTIGYYIMEGVSRIIRGRLKRRTDQFLMVMKKHPDIQKLL